MIDTAHSDVFAAWEKLGVPARQDMTPADIREIQPHGNLEMAAPVKTVTRVRRGDAWTTKLSLDPHGVAMFVLTFY